MPSNYDDVIRKNREYLTQAQISALAAAAKEYNIQNAGQRAGALASAREQYDAGYRGLQNMGLAGNISGADTSGEVPRLRAEIAAPFDSFNRRLNDVENKRINALGGQFAQQTQAARAAAAAARAQAEAQAAQAKAQADAAAAAARGARGQYDIDRSQTALIGERGEKSMPSKKAIDTYRQSGKALEDLKAIEATRTAVANAQKAQQDGMLRTQQIKERAAVMAAASVLGVQTVGTDNMALVRSVNNAQSSGAKRTEQLKGYADTATANRYDATGLGRLDQGEQERTAEGAKEAYERVSVQARAGKATAEQVNTARQAFLNAQKSADETPKAFDIDHEAARKEAAAEKAKLDGMKRTAQMGGAVSDADLQRQQAKYETATLKANDPDLYSAYVIKNAQGQTPQATEKANQIIVDRTLDMYGIRKPEWSDSDYKGNVQQYRAVKQMVAQADQVESGGGITDGIAARLKEKYGFKSIDEAREYVRTFGEERDKRSEYNYYAPAFEAAVKNEGLQPSKPVNNQEWDYTYRAVNNLPDFDFDTDRPTKTRQQMALVDVEYMTQQQRDAYNALYETQGIEAANAYAKAIVPIVNLQRASDDQRYYSELAKEHPVAADIMSVGMNLIGNVPAMASKLVTGVQNAVSGADVPKFIDINSNVNRISTGASTIRGARSELVGSGYYRDNATNWLHDHGLLTDNMKQGLDEFNDKAWVNNTLSFLYQSGMSMADSAAAMAIASMTGPWATDILFFSSAGNEAYNDARQRGATQEEALSYGILSGFNEALFEHVSVETFMENFVNSTPALAKSWLAGMASQSFTEASEEVCTEIANIYADMIALGDKSDWVKAQKQGPEAFSAMMNDKLKDIGMAGLGGLISGLGFGVFGGGMNAVRKSKYGSTIKSSGLADQYMQQARLLGGEDLTYAADSYAKKQSNNNAAELGIKLEERIKELSETKPGAAAKSMDVPAALTVVLEGSRMSAETGTTVLTALGAETVESMGYNATSGEALANSYNERIGAEGITSRSDALAQAADKINNSLQQLRGTGAMGALRRDVTSAGFQRAGAVADEYAQRRGEQTYTAARNAAATSVWANPTQGLAVTQADGTRITPMPGNMTAVERAEQERTNFQTRSTATKGRVTYAVAGMEARKGLTNEQTYSEIQNGLTKEARKKAQVYEKLADALGVNMVIHDVMTGTNGFIDEKGNMHVVLSGKQSVLRVAAHELTHWMKEHNDTGYASMREHLVKDVGQERFDRMLKQKAREYGIDMSTEKGRTVADDEVCAELCERMLADTDALERFAEKDTEAAKTLKDRLLKILNAIKRALKDVGNRDFGSSWSDLVHEQETIESWISNLQTAIDNATNKAEQSASEKTEDSGDLYMDAETERAQERKARAEATSSNGTYVRGYTAAEVESVIDAGMIGDRSNYEGDDYEKARSMIAQLIPEVMEDMGNGDFDEAQARIREVVTNVMETYVASDDGDLASLREVFPSVIGVDNTAKGDLKAQDQSLFQMSAKLSRALGQRVTLVSEQNAKGNKNAKFQSSEKLDELWPRIRDAYGLSESQDFSVDTQKLLEFIESLAGDRKNAREYFGSTLQGEIDAATENLAAAMMELYNAKNGTQFSLDTDYMRLAEKYKSGTATETETKSLQSVVEQAAEAAMPNSVARGKDGKLIKFFHGTKAEFTKFERSKIGSTGRFEGSGFNFTPYEGRARSYGGRVLEGYLNIQHPLSADKKTFSVAKLAQLIRNIDPTGDNIIANYARNTNDYGTPSFIRRESMTTARALLEYNESDVDVYSDLSSADPDAESLIRAFSDMGYDGLIHYDSNGNIKTAVAFSSEQFKLADPVTYDDNGNIIPLSERFNTDKEDIRYDLDTDAIREAFTVIDTEGMDDALKALTGVKHVGTWALKDISRFLDATAGKDKDLRNTLSAIFEKPHSDATGRYARGVERMQQRVLDIGARAGVVDAKGRHFDSKKSAAIQNIGEGFSNTYTDLKLKVKDADHVTVRAYEQGTEKLVVSERDYTLKELRQAYGTNAADYVWSRVFDETQKAQETGKQAGWVDESVNTRPYTIEDLQAAFPNDWQQLKQAADEFRDMYDEYIRDQNNMLRTIYPYTNEYESVEKIEKAIDKKQERLAQHKAAVEQQLQNLQKSLDSKEQEIASKKRTDTKAYRNLTEQANRISDQIATVKAEIAEYEANVKEELAVMNAAKAEAQNAVTKGDSLQRMHRLQYRSDYFHHFQEMASGIQNLKAIFTNNTDQDISPKIVGRSENTKAKTKWAGYYQQRMGGDYTADALNGMLRYGQLAEYKLAFDPLTAYLRDVNKQIRDINDDTNRDGLIRYIDQWADSIAGKSHKLDRMISDAGMAPRKAMQILNWINSRVIQNTLLYNMRSSLIQISNITNAKGIVTNNLDWMNGLRCWAAAAKGNEAMASIMAQSNFLASRYMGNMQLTESAVKKAKNFGGWMLGALDEISAKATWWAAYTQYQRNPNAKVIKNAYRAYDNAIDYADDVTRRTHAGRGVGELAPAMTSRVINFVAPFQVEVNNTFELFKDNVKRGNYLGLLSTGLSVFLFNTVFEALVGSSPLQFDFIRAVLDIVLGFVNDDPKDDDDDYGILQAWQRLGGEAFGSLPYAGQIASIIGEDVAKKIFGEDNDATRYGNTQIGISAAMNAGKGLYDIGKNLAEGKNVRQINWIADLDDLMNLTLPMGGKQLTRSIQGLYTVAQGYAGSNDKEGNEKVQFVTDQDVGHYIHAALFGKWALTEASEYFGEKRLLPQLFGKYEGPKSSLGKPVDAQEYKAALEAGITGKEYFTLKSDLSEYSGVAGKRAEMMEQSFTPEQKAKLDALLFSGSNETKAVGSVVYQKSSDGEWKVKADYANQNMMDLSQQGDKIYTGTLETMKATKLPQDQAALVASMWDKAKEADDSKAAFRDMLRDNKNLTVAQKEALDLQYCGNKYAADYSDPELYDLSVTNRTVYEKAKEAKENGVPVKTFTDLNGKKQEHEGTGQAAYMRQEIMKTNLSAKQKELLDDLLVSADGRNPDYSTQAWFDVSMLGKSQYETAQQGAKVGLKPETYMAAYNKYKEIQAKDSDGKYVNTKAEARKLMKEYLDGLTISAPVYDYIWYNVFKQKKK